MSEKTIAASKPKASIGSSVTSRRELGRADQLEHGVALPDRPVLRLVATGLAQEPDRRALDGKPEAGAQEDRGSARASASGSRGQRWCLPHAPPDEERPEPLEMERGLLRLAHPLDDDRERMQLASEQADDEVVVVVIEAVAREPDVVAEPGAARMPARCPRAP